MAKLELDHSQEGCCTSYILLDSEGFHLFSTPLLSKKEFVILFLLSETL